MKKFVILVILLFVIDGKSSIILLHFWTFISNIDECEIYFSVVDTEEFMGTGVLDINLFRCMLKKEYSCPHEDIDFVMYTP